MLSGHDEELSHHPRAFTDVLLHELRSTYSDELTVSVMCDSSGKQGLTSTWRSVQQYTLWLGDTQRLEDLRVLDWELDNFLDFLDLLSETTDHIIRGVWHFLDLHQGNQRIHL